jgi:hypothetical protein
VRRRFTPRGCDDPESACRSRKGRIPAAYARSTDARWSQSGWNDASFPTTVVYTSGATYQPWSIIASITFRPPGHRQAPLRHGGGDGEVVEDLRELNRRHAVAEEAGDDVRDQPMRLTAAPMPTSRLPNSCTGAITRSSGSGS